jgi:hypothetical protein
LVAKVPYRNIAERFGVSPAALSRHQKGGHLPVALVEARGTEEAERAGDLVSEVNALLSEAQAILRDERKDGRSTVALSAIREAGRLLELRGRLTGELDERPTVQVLNLHTDERWVEVRAAMVRALRDHPDALAAVRAAWRGLEAG